MPSNLGRIRRRLGDSAQSRQEQEQLSQSQKVRAAAPWGGYCPDLGPSISDWRDAEELDGLVDIGSVLRPAPGFAQLDSDSLPLGDTTPPAIAADVQPVVGLLIYRDALVSGGTNRRYAISAGSTGHLYELASNWTEIPYTGAGAAITGDTAGAGYAQNLCDFASYGADNLLLFTNGFNAVYKHVPGGANYTEFSAAVLNPFKARSVCAAFDRIFFINTSESGTAKPYRVRYTTRGASASLTGLGSGFIDFLEVASEGVTVRRLGSVVACYFARGVAILRETGNVNDPFKREYISTQRGLLGTFAVTDLGEGLHFGIFNDGWFFFSDTGQFREAGLRQIELGVFRKWHRTFYSQLNTAQLKRVCIQYDRLFRLIWIVWPDTTSDHPNRVWVYHIDTDTVWPLDGIFSDFPNCITLLASLTDSITYATVTSSYSTEVKTYADFQVTEGQELIGYGTRTGLVLAQDRRIFTVDGTTPDYLWRSYKLTLGRNDLLKTWARFNLTYLQQTSTGPAINIDLVADDQQVTNVLDQTATVTAGEQRSDYITNRLTGSQLGFAISGSHPAEFVEAQGEVLYGGGRTRKVAS